jgi:hypothetical protein
MARGIHRLPKVSHMPAMPGLTVLLSVEKPPQNGLQAAAIFYSLEYLTLYSLDTLNYR